ncbi:MAG: 6-carboxytetrahydropterin synthase QueD [Nitrospinae bacterium CG11_big_fil_rev_8_21_14_0_20_56_8]|nr:MAG: 6-carboxytetrahydropterin synthase QueD [Nitrospinae bacterium CG11_big_fil_rev_8_21_14_0_20_56_8]
MFEVTVKTRFSAAHRLQYYDGKYENLHGHNWIAIATAETDDVDSIGLGVDFVKLREKLDQVLSSLDYQNLNEVAPFDRQNPSAENIARWTFELLKPQVNDGHARLKRVEIREFEECGAAYFE